MGNRVRIIARLLGVWAPATVLSIFSCGVIANWVARADGPTVEWLQQQSATQAQRINDIQSANDLQMSLLRERLAAVETVAKEHGRKLDDIAATNRWIVFGVFGTLASMVLKRVLPAEPPAARIIQTLAARVRKS